MARLLIAYATRTGETERIGQLIAEGIRFSGGQADVIDVKDDGESTLVETPETARSDDQPQTDEAKAKSEPQGGDDGGDQPKPRRGRPRGPRKPKGGPDGDAPKAEPSAAE